MTTDKKNIIFISSFILIGLGLVYLVFIFGDGLESYSSFDENSSSCLSCHKDVQGMIPPHASLNCTSCHLGDGNAQEKTKAHNDMVAIPGNLSNVEQTCSSTACHPGINHRIENSMMNTMSGIINIDKYVFSEHQNLDSLFDVYHLGNSMADNHLRNKCASCHLGNEKTEFAPTNELTRGGGCLACHLNYSEKAKNDLNRFIDLDEIPSFHPSVSLAVTDDHCFGCHSRSGRISTNYEGWHETLLKKIPEGEEDHFRLLEDHRIFEKKSDDIHHSLGLSCIDCHDTWDVMGDGQRYAHKEEAVTTSCTDCHDGGEVKTKNFRELDQASQNMITSRGMDDSYEFVISPKYHKQLTHVILKKEGKFMVGKNNKKQYQLSAPSEYCTNPVHEDVSCSTCHTQWAPQCLSCHTDFDPLQPGFDLLDKKETLGTWKEKGAHFFAEYPSLGMVVSEGNETVKTFTPGMVMNLSVNDDSSFVRLFAPTSAHTITAQGKSCKECHNNSLTLGYGRGELVYDNQGNWSFNPQFENEKDGLPMDAWIAFLSNDTLQKTTRNNARPFTFDEQKKMLTVGACLTCHQDGSEVVQLILKDYKNTLKLTSTQCVLPKIMER